MSKALKSFEIIKKMYKYFVKNYRDLEPKLMICEKEDFDNVETALKEHELMKNTRIIVVDKKISDEDLEKLKDQRVFVGSLEQCEIKPLFDERTQKKLQALEIIVEKNVDVLRIKITQSVEQYNERRIKGCKNLTNEEYNLLKETLL